MKEVKNILVTGAGALLGQGILRALQMVNGHDLRVYSADPDYRASGHWIGDFALTIPMANDPDYIASVESIIKKYEIDLVLIGTDVELLIFARNKQRLEETYGCQIIVSPEHTIQIGDDKWKTVQFLKDNGLPYPDSVLSNNAEEIRALEKRAGLPLFIKPKVGARSIGAWKIEHAHELDQVLDTTGENIIQEYLPIEEGEYTAGTMVFGDEIFYTIILKRDLRDGNTFRAYSSEDPKIQRELLSIINKLKIYGPCNFQFRIRDNQAVIFEINSRFSGTTPLRTFFGINEIQVLLDFVFKGETPGKFTIKQGAVFRTFSDIFVSDEQLALLKENGELDKPKAIYYPFKEK